MAKGKLIPIRFNKEEQEDLNKVADLINLGDGYGFAPTSIKLSLTLTQQYIGFLSKVIPTLNISEMERLFASILNHRNPEKRHIVTIKTSKRQK